MACRAGRGTTQKPGMIQEPRRAPSHMDRAGGLTPMMGIEGAGWTVMARRMDADRKATQCRRHGGAANREQTSAIRSPAITTLLGVRRPTARVDLSSARMIPRVTVRADLSLAHVDLTDMARVMDGDRNGIRCRRHGGAVNREQPSAIRSSAITTLLGVRRSTAHMDLSLARVDLTDMARVMDGDRNGIRCRHHGGPANREEASVVLSSAITTSHRARKLMAHAMGMDRNVMAHATDVAQTVMVRVRYRHGAANRDGVSVVLSSAITNSLGDRKPTAHVDLSSAHVDPSSAAVDPSLARVPLSRVRMDPRPAPTAPTAVRTDLRPDLTARGAAYTVHKVQEIVLCPRCRLSATNDMRALRGALR
jgi:hypothetical protein